MTSVRALPQRLGSNQDGVTIVEFALIAPVLLLLLLGTYDLGYVLYVDSMLQGSIQEAGRRSTIEGSTAASMDLIVSTAVKRVVPDATLTFTRKSYATFSAVGSPEAFTDVDGNGVCNSGEPYEDANGNSTWDSDRGKAGQGGARDAVLYTARVTYPRPFAMAGMFGFSPLVTLSSATVLRNQPFSAQTTTVTTKNC